MSKRVEAADDEMRDIEKCNEDEDNELGEEVLAMAMAEKTKVQAVPG